MSGNKAGDTSDDANKQPQKGGCCFAIMPISDHPDYGPDHFGEVYESIIQPAVIDCGYDPLRADQVAATNLIHLDILKRILEAPIAVCDLSSANPNVMFELGLRQAFDKPVILIKDNKTRQIFDIDNVRTIMYDADMRPRSVRKAIEAISASIRETVSAKREDGANSIVALLGWHAAALRHNQDDPSDARIALIERQLGSISSKIDDAFSRNLSLGDMVRRGYFVPPASPASRNSLLDAAGSPPKPDVVFYSGLQPDSFEMGRVPAPPAILGDRPTKKK